MRTTLFADGLRTITKVGGYEGHHYVARFGSLGYARVVVDEVTFLDTSNEQATAMCDEMFAHLTGYDAGQWESFSEKCAARHFVRHAEHIVQEEGYPGEEFIWCNKCQKTLEYSFSEAAVM